MTTYMDLTKPENIEQVLTGKAALELLTIKKDFNFLEHRITSNMLEAIGNNSKIECRINKLHSNSYFPTVQYSLFHVLFEGHLVMTCYSYKSQAVDFRKHAYNRFVHSKKYLALMCSWIYSEYVFKHAPIESETLETQEIDGDIQGLLERCALTENMRVTSK